MAREVLSVVQHVKGMLPETIGQSATCLSNVNRGRAFVARDTVDQVF